MQRKLEKCSKCRKTAIFKIRNSGLYLCKSCYIDFIEKKIRKIITKYRLIRKGDKIAVGVSGGKDSLTLLYNLYKRYIDYGNIERLLVIIVDEGLEGYRDESLKIALNFIDNHNMDVDLIITSFKEHIGLTLDEMVKIIREKYPRLNACTVCGTFRRRILNDIARMYGANKLAIGHNLDDIAQTVLMNVLRKDIKKIIDAPPYSTLQSDLMEDRSCKAYYVPRIKPLIELKEEEITNYCYLKGFKLQTAICKYSLSFPILRKKVQQFLNKLDLTSPEIKYNLLYVHNTLYSTFRDVRSSLEGDHGINSRLIEEILGKPPRKCDICGYPSGPNRKICHYCELKKIFDIKEGRFK